MEWFRWYHGAISDPKWPLVARKSGKSIGVVVSIWASLLEHASQEQNRGSIEGFNPEAIDALFGYEDETTVTVCNAMRNAGIINAENFICSWGKRQPKRERDDDSRERVRRFREKQKANNSVAVHIGNDNETESNATETPSNAQNRTEQNREDKKKTLTATRPEYADYVRSFQSRVKDLHGNIAPKVTDGFINQAVDVIDKLVRIDGFSFDEIKAAMDWATGNDFWGKNALAITAVRKPLRDGTMKFKKIVADKERLDMPRIGKNYDSQFAGVI